MQAPLLPSISVIICLLLFLVVYLSVLLRNTIRDSLDILDFLLLSMVAVLPSAFALLPRFTLQLTTLVGVVYPFELLFGFLFVTIFIFLYRLLAKTKRYDSQIAVLVQELAMLRQELDGMPKVGYDPKKRGIPAVFQKLA